MGTGAETGRRTRFLAIAVAAAVIAAGAIVPTALADHGWDTFKFTNEIPKSEEKRNAFDIVMVFDRNLSHVEGHSWRGGAECKLRANKRVVECDGGSVITRGESFELAVAPPPPETQANIVQWRWTGRKGKLLWNLIQGCDRKGCEDVADDPPPPPFGRPE